jgi:hypothetical protein
VPFHAISYQLIGYGANVGIPVATGTQRNQISPQGSEREFGWKAMIPLEDGLRQTVGWYRETAIGSQAFAMTSIGFITRNIMRTAIRRWTRFRHLRRRAINGLIRGSF